MTDLIKAYMTERYLEFLEQSLVLTEEHKRASLQQKVIFWINAVAEEIERDTETPPVLQD